MNMKTPVKTNRTAMIPISSAAQWLRAMYTSAIFVLKVIHVSAIIWRALRLLAKHLESTFLSTSR
jgi:hypothetical protein